MSSIAEKSPFITRSKHSENRTVVSNSPYTNISDARIFPRSGSQTAALNSTSRSAREASVAHFEELSCSDKAM